MNSLIRRLIVVVLGTAAMVALVRAEEPAQDRDLASQIRRLKPYVLPPDGAQAKELRHMVSKEVRARRDAVNQRDTRAWPALQTKEDWERFRQLRLQALRESLGQLPAVPKDLKVRLTGTLKGDGFAIDNLIYESRPGLLVTANLYRPEPPVKHMPGILICHSHHNPKTQGELQDMGMTWARQGCLVLIMDQLGHGERRQHPFTDSSKYKGSFKPGRQDYYFRYNVAMQLHLIGDSLMGWMAWDMMRGADVLLARAADPKRIVLLGAVAGGGDPCAVTAALDKRIAAAVPFNFGGPQPETRFPLPDDAKTLFNYAGGGSWESTRNLRLSCRDGFLPWVIVGSLAPRGLIYAHEFAWDQERDPVWHRLQKIYGFYDASERLAWVKGKGSVRGSGPENTHCNNIGPVHRQGIYAALGKWFAMPVPEKEYQKRFPSAALQCLKPGSGIAMKPLFELAGELGARRAAAARQRLADLPPQDRCRQLRKEWARLLGKVTGRLAHADLLSAKHEGGILVAHYLLDLEAEIPNQPISIPVLLLQSPGKTAKFPVVVAVAQEGKHAFLKHRADTIAALLDSGVAVCLPDLRGTGESRLAGDSRGRASISTAVSSTELMLGQTVVGSRLGDLRAVLEFLRKIKADSKRIALWGDSFAPVNSPSDLLAVPLDADKLPGQSEPLGGLVALFGALYEQEIRAVYTRGGLSGYQSLLDSQFCYIPHDVIVPGALTAGDLCDVAAALAPRPLRLEGMVDGVNRRAPAEMLQQTYAPAQAAYKDAEAQNRLSLNPDPASGKEVADWLAKQLQ